MDAEYDFVVVGCGTGMLAAMAAAESGLATLIIEKSGYFGGSTALSGGGFWIPGSGLLREAGAADSIGRAREYLRHVVGGETPEERWGGHLVHGPGAVELLRRRTPLRFQWMRGYPDYFPEVPGGSATGRAMEAKPFDVRRLGPDRRRLRPPAFEAPFPMPVTGSSYKWLSLVARHPRGVVTGARLAALGIGGLALGREYVGLGAALAAGLFAGVRAMRIPVWFKTSLTGLVVEGGRVTGVIARRNGVEVTVRARRGVLLAAGGFDRDAALRHAFQSPEVNTAWSLGNPDNTGDVLPIAEKAGAGLAFLDEAWWFPVVPVPGATPGPLLAERSLPGQIIVDRHGHRFMNEAVNYMSAGRIMLRRESPMWMVFDQRYRDRYPFAASVLPRRPLPGTWYDAGIAARSTTVAGLSRRLGLAGLENAVRRFNSQAIAGRDDDFHRGDSAYDRYYGDPAVTPNPCLGPLVKPPFYAVRVVPGDLGTCGGVRADGDARALRPDGSPIDGLYASGNAAGNAFGRVYPGPGATIGQGLTFGYAAARHAFRNTPTG